MRITIILSAIVAPIVLMGAISTNYIVNSTPMCITFDQQRVCPIADSNVINVLQPMIEKSSDEDPQAIVMFDPSIKIGEKKKFEIITGFDGYLGIIAVERDGSRRPVYPNVEYPDGFIKKGKMLTLQNFQKNLLLEGNVGLGYLLVMVTEEMAYFNTEVKGKSYNGFKDDEVFTGMLKAIKSGKFGKYFLKLIPYFSYHNSIKSTSINDDYVSTEPKEESIISRIIKVKSDANTTQESVITKEVNDSKKVNETNIVKEMNTTKEK